MVRNWARPRYSYSIRNDKNKIAEYSVGVLAHGVVGLRIVVGHPIGRFYLRSQNTLDGTPGGEASLA